MRIIKFGSAVLMLSVGFILMGVGTDSFSLPTTQASLDHAKEMPQGGPSQNQEQKLAELKKRIAGQEKKRAADVFQNIQHFKEVPAENLLMVMNAFTRALGVSCNHCHVVDQWEKEDQTQKQIARDMLKLVSSNAELLGKIKNLKNPKPFITCSTCHRGQITPETNLPKATPKGP